MTHQATHQWQFKGNPCPFLKGKNHCTIYDLRPRTCRAFPFAKMLYATISKDPTKTVKFERQCGKSMTLYELFADPEFASLASLTTKFTAEQSYRFHTIMSRQKNG